MRRNYLLYLEDILASTKKILKYIGDSTYEDILKDETRIDAVVRNFEIIGEAASKIPDNIKNKYPLIEWRECIKKIYEADPLCCPNCGVEMKIISFISLTNR
jgi:uncharacterized protein with HEPN domain